MPHWRMLASIVCGVNWLLDAGEGARGPSEELELHFQENETLSLELDWRRRAPVPDKNSTISRLVFRANRTAYFLFCCFACL